MSTTSSISFFITPAATILTSPMLMSDARDDKVTAFCATRELRDVPVGIMDFGQAE